MLKKQKPNSIQDLTTTEKKLSEKAVYRHQIILTLKATIDY